MRKIFAALAVWFAWSVSAQANVPCSVPFNLLNGTTADATQVMANYNAIITCLGNAAIAGTNNDITALTALTTPISPSQGGSTIYIGATSTGSANAQAVAVLSPSGFSLVAGKSVVFLAGFTNTGATTLNAGGLGVQNLFVQNSAGKNALSGGELQSGNIYWAMFDGSEFILMNPSQIFPVTISLSASRSLGLSDCNNIVNANGGYLTVTLPAASLANTCRMTLTNTDSNHVKLLSGFPNTCLNNTLDSPNGILWPGQTETLAIEGGSWSVIECPGRWRATASFVCTVDTGGSDTTGECIGSAGSTSFASINHCLQVIVNGLDFSAAIAQPTCQMTCGQVFTESPQWVVPPVGTNTANITCAGGSGSQFTWHPSGVNPFVVLVGNNANMQFANVNVSGTGAACFSSANCRLLQLHNVAVLETLSNVTCTDASSGGTCIGTDLNTAGGGRMNIDAGLTIAGTVGNVIDAANSTSIFWSSTLAASSSPVIGQIFGLRGAGTNLVIQGNFGVSGSFGTARQWAVLNSAVLCNTSSTAIPGSTPGITTATGFAAGVAVNSGINGGC